MTQIRLNFTSTAFGDGGEIPRKYGYRKGNISPPLKMEGIPDSAESLVLIMDDPDALAPAGKVWAHWVLWNIPATTQKIPEGRVPEGASEGKTDFGSVGYGGPAPPDKEHTYVFRLYALDSALNLPKGATKQEVEGAIEGHVIERAELRGRYAP